MRPFLSMPPVARDRAFDRTSFVYILTVPYAVPLVSPLCCHLLSAPPPTVKDERGMERGGKATAVEVSVENQSGKHAEVVRVRALGTP